MFVRLLRVRRLALAAALPVLVLGFLSGCDSQGYSDDVLYPVREDAIVEKPTADPPRFERPGQFAFQLPIFVENGGKRYEPSALTSDQRAAFDRLLTKLFGTPAHPQVNGIDADAKKELQLDDATLARGSQLYRRHCLHCHGVSGDGRGPTAAWVNPHPRDYRAGYFKFVSDLSVKPRRDDLRRTLKQGIEGTSMPTFGLLPDEEIDAIISYVIHLSIRGQVEMDQMKPILADKDTKTAAVSEGVEGEDGLLVNIVKAWTDAESESQRVIVGPYPFKTDEERLESVSRGHRLFLGLSAAPGGAAGASCISCHEDYGRKNVYKYDTWGTITRPRDLTVDVYRGGRRPLDLYWRVAQGINGTAMPGYVNENLRKPDNELQKPRAKWNQEVWDLVNFIQALPYKQMLPEDVRQQVYPSDVKVAARE